MCCAALVFKEDILFNNHHHRCCYLRDDEDETKLFTSWAGPESVWTASEASRNDGVFKEVSRRFSRTADTLNFFLRNVFLFFSRMHVRYKKYQIKND